MSIVLPSIVVDRYREACASPCIMRWRSLAYLAGFQADTIIKHEPDSVMADESRTLSQVAWPHALEMEPVREPESHNSLAGVVLGWFRRAA